MFLERNQVMNYLQNFQDMAALRGFTDGTIKTYSRSISFYLDYLDQMDIQASWQLMRDFITWIQQQRGLSDRTVNSVITHLRFFTVYVLHKPWDPSQLPHRKFDQFLPFVPSRSEVESIINAIEDRKARTMAILMYGAGLRINEVCALRYEDVSRAHMRIHICRGKNRSDRYAMLAPFVLEALTCYWYVYGRPKQFLFHNPSNPDKPVSTAFIRYHIRAAEQKLGWPHRFSCHTFRRAFATHFYEDAGDLLTLKSLLGHRSLRSTLVYVNLSDENLKKYSSPIQSLQVSV